MKHWRVSLAVLLALCAVSVGADNGEPVYLWHEIEDLITARGWLTHSLWSPSGGRFVYPTGGAGPQDLSFDLPHDGSWAVWVRARDETDGTRVATATLNGEPTYAMGGAHTGHWVWYLLGHVEGAHVDLQLRGVPTVAQMDPWLDTLLLTDHIGFVPPALVPDGGYTAYTPVPNEQPRAAWLWYPADAGPGSVSFYRTSFELSEAPEAAELTFQAHGLFEVYLNGSRIGAGAHDEEPSTIDVTVSCRPGVNVLAAWSVHAGWLPGVKALLTAKLGDGATVEIATDPGWWATTQETLDWLDEEFDTSEWRHPLARIGEKPVCDYWPVEPPR